MDSHGNIVSWTFNKTGKDIDLFFPRQKVLDQNGLEVIRGGSHFCYPVFGTDPLGEMKKKHGFLRDLNVLVGSQTEEQIEFEFHRNEEFEGRYKNIPLPILKRRLDAEGHELFEELTIDLSSTGLNDYLNVGVHPYFRTPENGEFVLSFLGKHGNPIDLNNREHPFDSALFIPTPFHSHTVPGFRLFSEGLGVFDWNLGLESNRPIRIEGFYLWRDSNEYICVEPVYTEKNQIFKKGRGVLTFQSITRFTPA